MNQGDRVRGGSISSDDIPHPTRSYLSLAWVITFEEAVSI